MLYMLLCCFLMLNSTFVMFRAMSAISKGSAKENRSEISLIVLATLGIASPFIVAMITTHIMRLLISLWDVGTVFFTIYPQVFRHEKSSIYYKYIEPLSYCFSISFKILIITVYGFMKWYICKCLFCKVYLLDLSYNRNAKPMTGSNELRFNLTQIRG